MLKKGRAPTSRQKPKSSLHAVSKPFLYEKSLLRKGMKEGKGSKTSGPHEQTETEVFFARREQAFDYFEKRALEVVWSYSLDNSLRL